MSQEELIQEIERQLDNISNEKLGKTSNDWDIGYWFGRLETLQNVRDLLK